MSVVRLSKRLWKEYLHQVQIKAARMAAENELRQKREQLIVEHMPVARGIARQIFHKFRHAAGSGGSKIAFEDMLSSAYIGLVEAAGRWDPSKGDFAKYCYFRVRGAIIDAHRRQAYQELLPVSLEECLYREDDKQRKREMSLVDGRALPDELAGERQKTRVLVAVIHRVLPDDERQVIQEALAGRNVAQIAQAHGETPLWARSKLSAAKTKVTAEVQRRVA